VEHRALGRLTVSVVGLGCNQLGTDFCDASTAGRIVAEALDSGITFFDTADEYGTNYADRDDPRGWGKSEECLGQALQTRRDQVVIASKFGVPPRGRSDGGGGSARWAREAIEGSLTRLRTDYIDLYQLHFPDPVVPIEETLGVLSDFVDEGKVLEIGCSNFTPTQLREAAASADRLAARRFASTQGPLSLLQRRSLGEILPVCQELGLAFIPYWPLASGVLTGKYRRDAPLPGSSRLTDQLDDQARGRILSERNFLRLEVLEAYAQDHGRTLLELAFGWLLGQPNVVTVIAGAARPGQVSTNATAAEWSLTPGQLREVADLVESPGT
jgi:aryl-alcohol dehydrogenase-like predicted oxidoreductase